MKKFLKWLKRRTLEDHYRIIETVRGDNGIKIYQPQKLFLLGWMNIGDKSFNIAEARKIIHYDKHLYDVNVRIIDEE